MNTAGASRPYADPYLAGIGLGLVLLTAFVVVGRGLGASGAYASTAAGTVALVAPGKATASPLFSHYLSGQGPWLEWQSVELVGVLVGGWLSAALAGRLSVSIERSSSVGSQQRLILAFGGGLLMAVGAALARGCTSGQALTAGALLSVGGWLFLGTAFAAAYAVAPLLRKVWQ
ncbi:YeeE/YedE family protein [Tahibacter amnicola]|uniref:YeeE/YedE family protein n=1 Tax=Tahibacter amnicola TaxID=2976241 RepID=A0ABY6BL17_9GAMM|nr:YeeE/YedE family protein [Tahibacter amnicola]UXI70589.1 YeeE/YedE family protein [Tahibacter amnicola]